MLFIAIIAAFLLATAFALLVKNKRLMGLASLGAGVFSVVGSSIIAYKVSADGIYNPHHFIAIDSFAAIVMMIVAIVGCATAFYALPSFEKQIVKKFITKEIKEYHALINVFLACMFMTAAVSHPMASWIFLEATTLSTVFLVSFYKRGSTVEAAWKYLIINAVGLLLAFFGTLLFLAAAEGSVTWTTLVESAKSLDPELVQLAFVFALIGYGTKIGLAPMHTWKPDVYSKSPAALNALFSGAMMPVAFLILLKFKAVTDAAVGPSFSQHLLIAFGVLSVLVAAFSILTVKNYQRMLAFSTIEHAGLIALGFGFGGLGAFAAMLQLIYHSLIKSSLFYMTGNMLLRFRTTHIAKIRGMLGILPVTSVLFLIGLFAATGFPPFGIFLSELFMLSAGMEQYMIIAAIALIAIVVVFVGFFRQANAMVFGKPDQGEKRGEDGWGLLVPGVVLLALALVATFYMPPFIETLINQAVAGF